MDYLSLEELKKFENKPVWIVDTEDKKSYWAIVGYDQIGDEIKLLNTEYSDDFINYYTYGKTVFAYRCKPVLIPVFIDSCEKCRNSDSIERFKDFNFCPYCGKPLNNVGIENLNKIIMKAVEIR